MSNANGGFVSVLLTHLFYFLKLCLIAARCYASVAYAVMRCPSVCPSVMHVHEFCQNE